MRFSLLMALSVTLVLGCEKSETGSKVPPSADESMSVKQEVSLVARVHWAGKAALRAQTNAANLTRILALPETAGLQTDVLAKLSTAPWRFSKNSIHSGPQITTNLLQPLLEAILEQECWMEVSQLADAPAQWVMALQVDDAIGRLWETNLATALESLSRTRAFSPISEPGRGWSFTRQEYPQLIEFVHWNQWVLVGAAQSRNTLLQQTLERIQQAKTPFENVNTNVWLDAIVDFPRLLRLLGAKSQTNLPVIAVTAGAEGENLLVHAKLDFAALPVRMLEPWMVPTNLIHFPLASFTAVRGVKLLLESLPMWRDFELGMAPNQIYFWALRSFPMQSYFTAPWPNASNEVLRISNLILDQGHAWFATNDLALFQRSSHFNGLEWKGLPYMSPSFLSTNSDGKEFVLGGAFLPDLDHPPVPAEFFEPPLSPTNLVLFDWEMSSTRVEQWTYMAQFVRFVTQRPQLGPDSASLKWLKAAGPLLGDSRTEVLQTGPNQLTFVRRSSVGFTGIELQCLAQWLELHEFPGTRPIRQ